MASGAPLLALTATFVVAALVLPSSGRCPSLGPETPSPPAPTPAPLPSAPTPAPLPPAPAPPVLCGECHLSCITMPCSDTDTSACDRSCMPPAGCDGCRSRELEKCRACCASGTCSCDCESTVAGDCQGECHIDLQSCINCRRMNLRPCTDACHSHCSAICVPN